MPIDENDDDPYADVDELSIESRLEVESVIEWRGGGGRLCPTPPLLVWPCRRRDRPLLLLLLLMSKLSSLLLLLLLERMARPFASTVYPMIVSSSSEDVTESRRD